MKTKLLKAILLSLITVILIGFQTEAWSQDKMRSAMKRYVKVPAGYLMVLRQGDNVFQELDKFAQQEKISAANFTGMGFVNITFGFFDFETKKYDPKDFQGVELVSMHGTIAWKEGKPSIHSHGVVADKTFQSFGGHILSATVGTGSVEILLTIHDKRFERKKDETIGADVLQLE